MDLNKEINLIQGDCLGKMKKIHDKSINLVLIDPPYNINKADWDKWKTVNAYVEFMGQVFLECQRVLKDNGSFYFFHNDFLQIVELQNFINKNTEFKFKQLITLNKTNFKKYAWTNRNPEKCLDRNWFPNIEYCLFYTFQDETGLKTIQDDRMLFKSLRDYFWKERQKIKHMSYKEINQAIGFAFNGGGVASGVLNSKKLGWRFPKKETYDKFKVLNICQKPYEELRKEYEELRREYENQRYTFNLKEVQKNISCVWEVETTNSGRLHSCEKPINILEKIIKTSSNENDIVLDCFMGSGSTGVACVNTNRKFIGIEKDEKYFEIACNRIKEVRK